MNQDKTIVVFRVFKDGGDVIALFPGLNHQSGDANIGMCQSYMHVGQHGEADYTHIIGMTKPAKEWEYEDLAEELTSIGYDLTVLHKKPISL